jgi:hypothetical protein
MPESFACCCTAAVLADGGEFYEIDISMLDKLWMSRLPLQPVDLQGLLVAPSILGILQLDRGLLTQVR